MTPASNLQELALHELLSQYPAVEPVLQRYGLLAYAKTETAKHENLEASALVHGLNVDTLLAEIQSVL